VSGEPIISEITEDNLAVLSNCANDVFDNQIDLARVAACVRSVDFRLFVAQYDGMVIGQVRGFIQRQPDDAPWLYIDNLGVAEEWKRKGVATRLTQRLTDWGVSHGTSLVWLGSETDNDEATGFYDALGFSGQTMVVWTKALTKPLTKAGA
jgi:ribosomal protein S18 acetylase RimI-like enzyme